MVILMWRSLILPFTSEFLSIYFSMTEQSSQAYFLVEYLRIPHYVLI